MGIDYRPKIIFGITVDDFKIDDILIDGMNYPDAYCHFPEYHYYGLEISFEEYKIGEIPNQIKRFGDVLKRRVGITCDYYQVLFGDTCEHCHNIPQINFLTFLRLSKPNWSEEKCFDVIKEISGYKKGIKDAYGKDYDFEEEKEMLKDRRIRLEVIADVEADENNPQTDDYNKKEPTTGSESDNENQDETESDASQNQDEIESDDNGAPSKKLKQQE